MKNANRIKPRRYSTCICRRRISLSTCLLKSLQNCRNIHPQYLQNFILLPTTQTDCKLSRNCEYEFQQSTKNNIKGHVGKLENYQFNISLVSEMLSSITKGQKDLGISMTRKWAHLATETGVKKRPDFLQPKSLKADQVRDATKSHLFFILSSLYQCV